MKKKRFYGVVPPVVTPLTENDKLDAKGLKKILHFLVNEGCHGIFVLGTTGEGPTLPDDVKEKTIQLTVEEVKGRVPVYVGVGAEGLSRTLKNVKIAEKAKADCVVVCAPYYFPINDSRVIYRYFSQVSNMVNMPLMIYNIPQTTKIMIEPETIEQLSRLPNVIGVKDSSGDVTRFEDILSRLKGKDDFSIFMGNEELLAWALLKGADGFVPGIANIEPGVCIALYEAAKKGQVKESFAYQEKVGNLRKIMSVNHWLSALKGACELRGLCSRYVASPLSPVTDEELAEIRKILS